VRKRNIIITTIGIVVFFIIFLPGYTKLNDLKVKNARLGEQVLKLKEENKELTEEQKKLREDLLYIEKVAREELGLARDGEIIYKIEEEMSRE